MLEQAPKSSELSYFCQKLPFRYRPKSGRLWSISPGMQASEDELKALAADHLAKFEVPASIIFVTESLPRNANGNLLKKDLNAKFEAAG